MFDSPVSGRIFVEQVLHDSLGIGRPDELGRVFDRRPGCVDAPRATVDGADSRMIIEQAKGVSG